MSLSIVEVMGRAPQGMTRPYICRCDDDEVYYVKGAGAGRRSLINEWLCGNLAEAFGLPIAPFCVAEVPVELIEADPSGWLRDLGVGEVFASRKVLAQELTMAQMSHIDVEKRHDVIMFDWWVRNGDRCLTAHGGNVNLLWQPHAEIWNEDGERIASGQMTVIDHNLAFDDAFSPEKFCDLHVFADDLPNLFSDYLLRDAYRARFEKTLQDVWPVACNNLPSTWNFNPELDVPTNYPFAHVKAILDSALTSTFWTLPT